MDNFDNIPTENNEMENSDAVGNAVQTGSENAADVTESFSDKPVQTEQISDGNTEQQSGPSSPYAGQQYSDMTPYLNKEGGVFAEKDFGEQARVNNLYQQPAAYNGNAGGYGYAPVPNAYNANNANNMYRQMYGCNPYQNQNAPHGSYGQPPVQPVYNNAQQPQNADQQTVPTGGQANYSQAYNPVGNAPQQTAQNSAPVGGHQYNAQYAAPQNNAYQPYPAYPYGSYIPPMMEDVSPPQTKEIKKSSKVWLVIMIVLIIVMICVLMILLASNHKGEVPGTQPAVADSASAVEKAEDKVTVNISVAPRPVDDDIFYQNKETGMLTPAGAAHQVLPSVVNIYGYKRSAFMASMEASGIIISDDGYIITNAHAVEDIDRFKAKLNDGREFEAVVLGYDTQSDLAVLKIEASDLVPAVIGKSGDMLQGEQVVAIGNANGYNDTVTVGSVSYVGREITSYTGYPVDCIQTDAALNYGNSGGALVNMYGQVVGIVVSKNGTEGSESIGFCISSDFAVPVIEDIISKGYVTGRPRIGIIYTVLTPDQASSLGVKPGLYVSEIAPECDVANTELKPDDIITELDGVKMTSKNEVKKFQINHKPGDKVKAKVYRKTFEGTESEFEIEFTLDEMK